ncbi:MAG TPA: alkaline phosphatase family protein [Vicinamibacterales bacterium]|nr:alkaline phosphatase family protein [Vicinamibacterales bacterium]
MFHLKYGLTAGAVVATGLLAWSGVAVHAADDNSQVEGPGRVKTVFVIAMENHNWTQPATQTSPLPVFQNAYAPFLNSLVDGTSGITDQVAYASHYINAGVGVHPSEPSYIWAEAGTNFNVFNDNQPYKSDCSPDSVQPTDQHLSSFLMKAGRTWRSYQEDTDVDPATNLPLPRSAWTVPLFNLSGTFANGLNSYDYSNQYNYAAKHNPMVFFTDTAGGCNTTTMNPMRLNYAPLQQLTLDLQNDTVADYNWITPNQFNDMHTTLSNGYGGPSGAPAKDDHGRIAQGDNFLARIVPLMMASDAYRNHGMIVLWWDESEGGDDPSRTLPFLVISKDVKPGQNGLPYGSQVELSHSSTLRTMQEIFHVDPSGGYPWLGAAATADDLSDLFRPGVIH